MTTCRPAAPPSPAPSRRLPADPTLRYLPGLALFRDRHGADDEPALNDLLTVGLAADLSGEGAFLQVSKNVAPGEKPRTWQVGDKRIDPNSDTVYRVAIPDFLLKGGEKAYREAGLLKERKTEEDLRAMRLDADGIALSDTDRGKGKRPEIRAGLVNALIQSEEKPDIVPDPDSIPRTINRVKRPPAQSEATVRCGLIPSDGGFPAPPPPPPPPPRPRRIPEVDHAAAGRDSDGRSTGRSRLAIINRMPPQSPIPIGPVAAVAEPAPAPIETKGATNIPHQLQGSLHPGLRPRVSSNARFQGSRSTPSPSPGVARRRAFAAAPASSRRSLKKRSGCDLIHASDSGATGPSFETPTPGTTEEANSPTRLEGSGYD